MSCWARAIRALYSSAVIGWMRSPSGRRESKAGGSFVSSGFAGAPAAGVAPRAPGAITAAAHAAAPLVTNFRREMRMSSSMEAMLLVKVRNFYNVGGIAATRERELLQIARPHEPEDQIGIEVSELAGSGAGLRARKIHRLQPDIRNSILSDDVREPAVIRRPIQLRAAFACGTRAGREIISGANFAAITGKNDQLGRFLQVEALAGGDPFSVERKSSVVRIFDIQTGRRASLRGNAP